MLESLVQQKYKISK